MSEFESIQKLWDEHMSRTFPSGLVGEEFDGECLASLDQAAAGSISTFLDRGKAQALDATRFRILKECAESLSRICPQLPDEHRVYFDTLREMSERVVRFCRRGSA